MLVFALPVRFLFSGVLFASTGKVTNTTGAGPSSTSYLHGLYYCIVHD